jgi:hypothetical protein
LVLSVIAFGGVSFFAFYLFNDYPLDYRTWGEQISFLYVGVFYASLALFFLIKGIREKQSNNDTYQPVYRGDSSVLGFLIPAGLSQNFVQTLIEPLFLLIIGASCLSFNKLLGLPLIACSLSYWLFFFGEMLMGLGYARSVLANKGHAYSKNRKFSKAS